TRAAVEEGIVPGGGVALLRSRAVLDSTVKAANQDQRHGIAIVRRALEEPVRIISENAGIEGSVVVSKILENNAANFGYDASVGEYTDLVARGVIDPTKVVRHALQSAGSVASLMITTEAVVAELPKKDSGPKGGGPGMGGGMGDMDM
ncbi:MAG: chaperonin GroEL, partial [Magnetococcales bacterium]|nr:chaperonin GroEL [Magnetococcales bacterium]